MRIPLALLLSLSVALAGCTLGRERESSGVDKSEYDGGTGFALAIRNDGQDPFEVTLRVLGVGNTELALIEETLEAGDSLEKWYSLEENGTYSARLAYEWNAATGRTASGTDEQLFSSTDCPLVSRLSWELRQSTETVGSAYLGKTCVADGVDENS